MDRGEGLEQLLTYIKELETQNVYLRKLVEDSDWQIARLQLLQQSLLSRIYQMRRILEDKRGPATMREEKVASVLASVTKSKEDTIIEEIFEDEQFKREIGEAVEFARLWKEKKTVSV
jgi:hypothetical protein